MPLVFGLDLSYHAGWCVFDTGTEKLVSSGTIHLDGELDDYGAFPHNYQAAAEHQAIAVFEKIEAVGEKLVVIEAINKGKNRWSQLRLDMLHGEILRRLKDYTVVYIDSSAWRKTMDIKLDKAGRKNNANVAKAKKLKVSKKSLGVKGKIGKKHLAIAKVNEMIEEGVLDLKGPLKLKDNDLAESCLLTLAYLKGCPHSDPNRKER